MNHDDIIELPHFHADGRPYMSNYDRAGQFMPFMSLKGFDDMIYDSAGQILNREWVHIDFNDDELSGQDYFPVDDDGGGEIS